MSIRGFVAGPVRGLPVRGLKPSEAYGHAVVRVDERYLMTYMSLRDGPGLYAAVSDDGLDWTMLGRGRPILQPRKGTSDVPFRIGHPFLMQLDGRLRMYYFAYFRQTKPARTILRIGLAETMVQ